VRAFVLAPRFSRSAADRFVRAYARTNRVGWRPLATIKGKPVGEERPASGHGREDIVDRKMEELAL
jgi:hypothetical protein